MHVVLEGSGAKLRLCFRLLEIPNGFHPEHFWAQLAFYPRLYATHAFSLTEATKNATSNIVGWNGAMIDAFQVLCDVSVLFLPTVVQTDASGRGVGAVLSVCRDLSRRLKGSTLLQSWSA